MKKERFNTLKKASLASTLGIFVFTYAGITNADESVIEEDQVEFEETGVIETESFEILNESAEDIDTPETINLEDTEETEKTFSDSIDENTEYTPANDLTEVEEINNSSVKQAGTEEVFIEEIDQSKSSNDEILSSEDSDDSSEASINDNSKLQEVSVAEAAIVINDDMTEGYYNYLTVIDLETNEKIATVNYTGLNFDDRLQQFINDTNNQYGTSYNVSSEILTSRTRNSSSINGNTVSSVNSYYNIYLQNDSATKYPFEDRPLIPSYPLYDETATQYTLKDVVISDTNGNILFSNTLTGTQSIDQIIKNSLSYIDETLYYYDTVEVDRGFTTRFSNGGFYSGEFYDITVMVNERTVEEVTPEQPETPEEPVEEVTQEQPETPEEPVEEVTPEQPETPEEPVEEVTPEQPETPEEPVEEVTPEQPETPEEPVEEVTPEQPETPEEPVEEVTPEQPETPEEPVEEVTPEQPETPEEPVEEVMPEQPETPEEPVEEVTPEQPETPEEPVEEITPETELSEEDQKNLSDSDLQNSEIENVLPTSPAIDSVESEDNIISGSGEPNSEVVISLPNRQEIIAQTDSDGKWQIKLSDDINIEEQDTILVTNKVDSATKTAETTVQSSEEKAEKDESKSEVSEAAIPEKEELPDTGIASSSAGLIGAVIAFIGGAFLLFTGRRKIAKK